MKYSEKLVSMVRQDKRAAPYGCKVRVVKLWAELLNISARHLYRQIRGGNGE